MTENDLRKTITGLIELWGGMDDVDALKRVAGLIRVNDDFKSSGSNPRFVRRWLAGDRDLKPENVEALTAMIRFIKG